MTTLATAVPVIEAALKRLLEKPKAHRPFVIIEVAGSDVFVQFTGSDQEQLVFDVPAWSLTYRVLDPEAGALLACTCLQRHFEIPLTATLRIVENAGGPSGERS